MIIHNTLFWKTVPRSFRSCEGFINCSFKINVDGGWLVQDGVELRDSLVGFAQ